MERNDATWRNDVTRIMEHGIVAVIRGVPAERVPDVARALRNGGVRTLEVTAGTPGAMALIERLAAELGGDVLVGAGTVLDAETARAAILSGARFIFSPTVHAPTIAAAKRYGVVSIPGAMTPTEIVSAYERGADLIKVFPASVLGPRFFSDVRGPLPHIPLMPTGGVDASNLAAYVQAGAAAFGVGGSLLPPKETWDEEGLSKLTLRARRLTEALIQARSSSAAPPKD
ncbi:bifunctional 4-hydroxy-2-oxoglutarate aldolase/2-dehydro-3-deoxy-phosphogluconate aldolase [Paenibacillus sp.]|uniref:bifunctional 4-hydroxy-2-oxoglutarate aldolase/2-dehydro-3-deoxy-phosphogluconate aldolase n=1 Tax=Paenibacillus sp. TaxID=58172 RepID=UPI002D25D25C|nr:bifunctional 4-hydroxy-2-oxoglutarate aldolase/2-dehydro-3-deoxy-phosphogluconate aldolase [Paenibacillus sp.]HZG85365.1 bifunctional 4-hydroxy-2-oxoglutarate aldolase/2-dehydro-3-deoxy-phosphogluconate aldolase [Paenibacillus sp.]